MTKRPMTIPWPIFIGDYRLDKERKQDEGKDLREGNEVELFDILNNS